MNLLANRVGPVGGGKSNRHRGIRGGAQRVRAHMRDGCGLPCRFSRCDRRGATYLTGGGTPDETPTDLFCDAELTASKGARPSDRITRSSVGRSLRLEQSQHPLRAIGRPRRNDSPIDFAQRLRRAHAHILPGVAVLGRVLIRLLRYYVSRSSIRAVNDPGLLILTSLVSGPKHGHALLLDIESFAGVRLGPGTLYGAITRLEERGLIEPLEADERRRPYRITAAGSSALSESLSGLRRVVEVGMTRLAAAT